MSLLEESHASIMPGGRTGFFQVRDLPGDDEVHLRVNFNTRNGNFQQDIELTRVAETNTWTRKIFTCAQFYEEKHGLKYFEQIGKRDPTEVMKS